MVTIFTGSGDPEKRVVTVLGGDTWVSSAYYGHCRDILIAGVLALPLLILIAVAVFADPIINKMKWSK